jgi:hypothetical protein
MKVRSLCLGIACVLFSSLFNFSPLRAIALDREAFSITNYDLHLQVDPEQQRLGVRGKITLRNDSASPLKIAILQISSSLAWRSIKAAGENVQFITQPYTSDIDHTGALSEAIVTLPAAVAAKGTVELEVGYEGIIALDTTRLTRIGTPEAAANSSDWDEISPAFTGVRGAGHVAWYPIATEVANLSEDGGLFDVLGRWMTREASASMEISLSFPTVADNEKAPTILCDGIAVEMVIRGGSPKWPVAKCSYRSVGTSSPTFLSAGYDSLERSNLDIYYLPGHDVAAANFADAAEKSAPLVYDWFGAAHDKARTADLPDPTAAPFESHGLLLVPLASIDPKSEGLSAAHQLTHASFTSPRPWIEEGLAHFAQALYLEQQKGRKAALDYMGMHRAAFEGSEPSTTAPRSDDEVNHSLINTTSEDLYRTKAMYVWWMLRDMVGEAALKKAIAAYRPEEDKEPSYMQRLIQAQTQHDLEWFFDDWVYRDRGLPDFKIGSAFSRKAMTNTYMLTLTVENLGTAGAEVPVIVKFAGGEKLQRLEVHAKSKTVIRIELPGAPSEVVVNDGSVPETELKNNVFQIPMPEQ